jgi:hypothetical protein
MVRTLDVGGARLRARGAADVSLAAPARASAEGDLVGREAEPRPDRLAGREGGRRRGAEAELSVPWPSAAAARCAVAEASNL